jgi:hypothetical protein
MEAFVPQILIEMISLRRKENTCNLMLKLQFTNKSFEFKCRRFNCEGIWIS